MSVAEIHATATLTPSKDEMCARLSGIAQRLGSYRAVDPEGAVGIEILVGESSDGRIIQLPVTYRNASHALPQEIMVMDHSVLGKRSVAYATSDPVALAELIRLILTGEKCAEYSAGQPLFTVRGSGSLPEAIVRNLSLTSYDATHATGAIEVDGEQRGFSLSFPVIDESSSVDDSGLALVATRHDDPLEQAFPVAYLSLH